MMKKGDRESLLQVCRLRTRVAKADVAAIAARRKAEFEAQLATIYSFDQDGVWKDAHEMAVTVTAQANAEIAKRAKEFGIPRQFMPSLSPPHWYGRGENAIRQRRAELTRVAHSKIDQLQKEAHLNIERLSAETQTKIVVSGLESEAAHAFLESMPTAEQLIPAVTIEEARRHLLPSFESDGEEQSD